METRYDEQLILETGLNVKLTKGIHLIDILRLEFHEEIRRELAIFYLHHVSRNTNYSIFDRLPSTVPDYCIALLPDWSLFMKSKHFYQGILISPLLNPVDLKIPTFCLVLNHTSLVSYKILGLASLFLSLKNPVIFLEAFKKAKLREIAIKTIHDLKNLIYLLSKIPYRTLQFDIDEARDLLKQTKPKQIHRALVKPLIDIGLFNMKNERKLDTQLYDIHENSESLEYSPTQEVSELSKFATGMLEKSTKRKNVSALQSDNPSSEEPTKKRTIMEFNEVLSSRKFLATPVNSPKQSNFSINEIKEKMRFEDFQGAAKEKSAISECCMRISDANKVCACTSCLIY